jgi:hypothetical protein
MRSIRASHAGVDWGPFASLGLRKARAETARTRQPTATSTAEALDGVVCLELKSWPWRMNTMSTASTPIASSHPQMKAMPRRRPAGMVSRTIMVTTEPGLVTATASPNAASSGITEPTALPAQHPDGTSSGMPCMLPEGDRYSRLSIARASFSRSRYGSPVTATITRLIVPPVTAHGARSGRRRS